MKFLIMVLFTLFFSPAKSQVAGNKFCSYNCPSVSAGFVKTFGNISDLLDNGSHFSIGFTPKFGIENFNQKISDTNLPFISKLKLSFSVEWYHFTGQLLNRKTDYYAPAIHLNWIKEIFNGQINSSVAWGYGVTDVERTGYRGTQWTSLVLLNSTYEKSFSFGALGAGVEIGEITNSNYPINHYGIFAKYGHKF